MCGGTLSSAVLDIACELPSVESPQIFTLYQIFSPLIIRLTVNISFQVWLYYPITIYNLQIWQHSMRLCFAQKMDRPHFCIAWDILKVTL